MKKTALCILLFLFIASIIDISAQEALKSVEEEYYDLLSLQGLVERPTLGYRTLSDSVWVIDDETEHPWKENNLETTFTLFESENPGSNIFLDGIKQSLKLRIYGPEWYNSYNSKIPYGQNDGALWQGVGYNTSFTTGIRLEGFGFEATFKPQITWSQNKEWDYLTPYLQNDEYKNKASEYGYFNGRIDLVQRFGNNSFSTIDYQDSEIRYTLYSFTTGFGFQNIWLGPSRYNPILHSNNAPTYPKFDIGFRKTELVLPFTDLYLGDFEMRCWLGYLSESKYFDNIIDNNHNQNTSFYFSYAPSFLPGLSIGATKVCLTKWGDNFYKYLNPFYHQNQVGGVIGEDQKASIYFDYYNSKGSVELYAEYGIDDYLNGGLLYGFLRYPYDSLVKTYGLKKGFTIGNLVGDICLEFSDMEIPRNRLAGIGKGTDFNYFFNGHSQITQGYTNKGQVIGSELACGGNSQTIQIDFYHTKGSTSLFLQRMNPNNTYSYFNIGNNNGTYKGIFTIGCQNCFFLKKSLITTFGFDYQYIINSKYSKMNNGKIMATEDISNMRIVLGIKYVI